MGDILNKSYIIVEFYFQLVLVFYMYGDCIFNFHISSFV